MSCQFKLTFLFNFVLGCRHEICGTWEPYADHIHKIPDSFILAGIDHSNHLYTMLHDLLLSLVYVTSYLTAWFILCTWQATWLHSSLNVTEEDVITACVPDTVEEIQVWGSLTLMNWSIHCTPNCSPTHQHCFHGNKNLSALSVHGNKMPVHPKPETNLRLKNSMFQASPTSSFWWLIKYTSLSSLILPSVYFQCCVPGERG